MEKREIYISVDEYEKRVAILQDSNLEDFFLERVAHAHLAGNVYKGKVAQVVKGMEAAFVDIGLEKNGFLYIDDLLPEPVPTGDDAVVFTEASEAPAAAPKPVPQNIEQLLTKGQEVLVQVVKEPFGTKGCRLTSQVSLPGRFLVLMPYSKTIGISKRITDEKERLRLKEILRDIGLPKDMGCIIRTQALGLAKKEFARELRYLMNLWKNIRIKAARRQAPCLIHEECDLILRTARDFLGEEIHSLVIDNKDDYKRLMGFIGALAPHLRRRIRLYKEKMPLFEVEDIDHKIEEIFRQKIPLKKGGYIVIERTEALISIDVNSGSFVDRGKLEETAFLTNLEAAKEIARQITLKDLAGIIIIDFIDMEKSGHQRKVLQVLEKALERDKARSTIYPFSPLGIVQIARQRVRQSLESVMFEKCPCCEGRGRVKSIRSIAISVLRKIKQYLKLNQRRQLEAAVHPQIAMRLLNEDRMAITALEKRMWVKITVLSDEHLSIEDVRFL